VHRGVWHVGVYLNIVNGLVENDCMHSPFYDPTNDRIKAEDNVDVGGL
jgi:hypothetical protein